MGLQIPDRFRPGLAGLLTAYDYALDSQADVWQFATELPELISSGATLADIRWLVLRGFAEHARETTIPGDDKRVFRRLVPSCFPAESCVVLTPAGAESIRSLVATNPRASACDHNESPVQQTGAPPDPAPAARLTPEWDAAHRELRFNGKVVKRYRVPAGNQAAILDAFQEDGWPEFIDDPISPEHGMEPKDRLKVTIKGLNRNQINPLIRFHGNGNGLQVFWEVIAPG